MVDEDEWEKILSAQADDDEGSEDESEETSTSTSASPRKRKLHDMSGSEVVKMHPLYGTIRFCSLALYVNRPSVYCF